jgi:23S rRNA (adenine2030-N6)-methyltransferase
MNYNHAFHAGNFADVHKHVILTLIVGYLKRKDTAFRVLDTHAGSGAYDLRSDAALRTGEWVDGVARLVKSAPPQALLPYLKPYISSIEALNAPDRLDFYPGSPAVARHLLRRQDRMTLVELHPQTAEVLKARYAEDQQVKVMELDAWLALGAQLPPKEKRGLVLVDPPFEVAGEFERIVEGLRKAVRRWPGGIYALWYPIKDRRAVAVFRAALASSSIPKILDLWIEVEGAEKPGLQGSGMVVVNPPYVLEAEMGALSPFLSTILGRSAKIWGVDWLTAEAASA